MIRPSNLRSLILILIRIVAKERTLRKLRGLFTWARLTGMTRLLGPISPWVHMKNFSPVSDMRKGRISLRQTSKHSETQNHNFRAYHSFGNSYSCITAVRWDVYDVENTAGNARLCDPGRQSSPSLCQALRQYSGDVLNEQSENKTRATWERGRWRVFLFLNDFSLSPLSRSLEQARVHPAFVPVTGLKCSYGNVFSPLTEIPVGKTEISGTEPTRPLIWTHRKFYKGFRGEARSRKPGPYGEALNSIMAKDQSQRA